MLRVHYAKLNTKLFIFFTLRTLRWAGETKQEGEGEEGTDSREQEGETRGEEGRQGGGAEGGAGGAEGGAGGAEGGAGDPGGAIRTGLGGHHAQSAAHSGKEQ
jgi:hypothetical protein